MTAPTTNANALSPGYQLDAYRIDAILGQGGFGITYRAHDLKLGADVAIKEYFPQAFSARQDRSTIVPRNTAGDTENYHWGLAEFLKEAQALAKFKHAHIVRVLRFFEGNGTAYMVMEYEEGETLSAFVRRHAGFLDEPTLLRIFLPVLGGLQAVHDAGVLHLDIKPDNIYLRKDETPMLIDFGSARQLRNEDAAEKVMLTPGYAAIEQYPGHGDVGTWSDVYSMGATIYRCITGESPIDSLQRYETYERSRMDPLRRAVTFERPPYSAHIRKCVDASLSMSSSERPASAFVLQQGLMGKDMSQVGKTRVTEYRPGTGFLGVLPTSLAERKQKAERHPLEKLLATLVFVATVAVVTPKILVDSGRMTADELYGWVQNQRIAIAANTRALGDFINEKLFLQPPRVTITDERVARAERLSAALNEVAPLPVAAPTPYTVGMKQVKEIAGSEQAPLALGFLKHGAILAIATDDGLIQLWDVQSGEARATLSTQVRTASALGMFPNSQWLAASDRQDAIVVYDSLGNQESVLRNDPPHPIMVMTASNRLLAETNAEDTVTLWDPFQNRQLHQLKVSERRVRVLAFAPDEKLLAAGGDAGGLSLWETGSGRLVSHRVRHPGAITALAFSPDGRTLASGGTGGAILLWTLGTEAEPTALPQVPWKIHDLAFSPDGHWLMAIGADRAVTVWDITTKQRADAWNAHEQHITALAVSTDGRRLATTGLDGVVRIWE